MVPRFENCDKKRVKKTSLFEEKRYHNLTTKKHLKELTKNKLFFLSFAGGWCWNGNGVTFEKEIKKFKVMFCGISLIA